MKCILFTKEFNLNKLQSINNQYIIDCKSFIEKIPVAPNMQEKKLLSQFNNLIITSEFGAQVAVDLQVEGNFFLVGDKAKNILNHKKGNIKIVATNAHDLVNNLKESKEKDFVYLCSNLRLNTIPEGLKEQQKTLKEIIIYQTKELPLELEKIYNAYVFFSPSGVRAFHKKNQIPKEAKIFSMGSSTSKELATFVTRKILQAEKPKLESLLELIKSNGENKKR